MKSQLHMFAIHRERYARAVGVGGWLRVHNTHNDVGFDLFVQTCFIGFLGRAFRGTSMHFEIRELFP